MALKPMDDLGIVVLFSVFESAVRDHLEGIIKPLAAELGHPLLRREPRPTNIANLTASEAFARLKELLDTLGIAAEPELDIDAGSRIGS